MMREKEQIRNEDGRLLCEAVFREGQWYITIKNHGVYTTLQLQPNGKLAVANHIKAE